MRARLCTPAQGALSQLESPGEGPCSLVDHLKSDSIPDSRQQLPCGLYLSSHNPSQFINKMLFLDCQVPVTSTRQAVISVACESSLIMEILLPDSCFCQLYRVCGCTQRELPGTMAKEMIYSPGAEPWWRSPGRDALKVRTRWYCSPLLPLRGFPTSLTQPGADSAFSFLSPHFHAFS